MFLFQVVDNYTVTYTVLSVCILELIAISWVYGKVCGVCNVNWIDLLEIYVHASTDFLFLGAERFLDDINFMIGYRPSLVLWSFMWKIVTTGFLLVKEAKNCIVLYCKVYYSYQSEMWIEISTSKIDIRTLYTVLPRITPHPRITPPPSNNPFWPPRKNNSPSPD